MQAGTKVVYVDAKGQEHSALAISENGLNPGRVTLIYVHPVTGEVVNLFDVVHMSDPSKQENNPDLPNYSLNCWKHEDEYHQAPPSDHPIFDGTFKQPELDDNSKVIPIRRPKFDADVAAVEHLMPEEMQDELAAKALETMAVVNGDVPSAENAVQQFVEQFKNEAPAVPTIDPAATTPVITWKERDEVVVRAIGEGLAAGVVEGAPSQVDLDVAAAEQKAND